MRPASRPIRRGRRLFALALGGAVSACSASSPYRHAGQLGYGTPGVSSYVRDGRDSTLQAELDRCAGAGPAASEQSRGLAAACDQLHRTMRNQPGNDVQPAR